MSETAHAPGPGYRVLARKYRPASFDDLIGQDAMVRTLSNAFETGRIPQAWMLTGVRGVGKTTTARILARALNYVAPDGTGGPTVRMPEFGLHCQAIVEGRHIDVIEMDAASHTGIDDIREITDAARYPPMSARYKVYIIDEVHMLSNQAFNGLLKTLEEPPPHLKFVFATTEIRKVPVTVLSRCQRFDLRRVDAVLLAAHLARIAEKEAVTLAPDAAALLARAGEGSVRDALSLLDQAIAHGAGEVSADVVHAMLGLVDRLRVFDLVEAVFAGDAARALALFAGQFRDGGDPPAVIGELAACVHAITRAKVAPDSDPGGPQAERERVAVLAPRLSLRVLTRAWQMLLKGHAEVTAAPHPAAAAEMLLVRLCHAADLPTPDEVLRRLDAADSSAPTATGPRPAPTPPSAPRAAMPRPGPTASSPVPTPKPAALPAPATSAPAEPARPHLASFADLVALAQAERDVPLRVALERNVHLVRFEPRRIELRLAEGADATLVANLQKRLLEWTGERWMIVLSREAGEPTLREQAETRRRDMVDDVRSDPAVRAILTRFPGAEIVDVRVLARTDEAEAAFDPGTADDD